MWYYVKENMHVDWHLVSTILKLCIFLVLCLVFRLEHRRNCFMNLIYWCGLESSTSKGCSPITMQILALSIITNTRK
jgi:hypothetical protein